MSERGRRGGTSALLLASTLVASTLLLWACEPQASPGTGGVKLPVIQGEGGVSCGRGLAVLMTDYASTNIGVLDLDGVTRSGSLLSSASTQTTLNAPLSGDVVLPSALLQGELVVLDRYPTAVLTFASLETAQVRGQLDVGQGFASNPQDYLRLDEHRALVSRLEQNPDPEATRLERGDDILVVDPTLLEIVDVIELDELRSGDFLARPGNLVRVGESVFVSLAGHDPSFGDASVGRLARIDVESLAITGVTVLEGTKNCSALALSPDGLELTVSCSGLVDGADERAPADAALVRLSVQLDAAGQATLTEVGRHPASDFDAGPFAFSVAYATPTLLLLGTFGAVEGDDAGRPDAVHWLDTQTGEHDVVVESEPRAFTLGQISCAEPCGVCFIADAGRGVVHRLTLEDGVLGSLTELVVETAIGLPPRHLGRL